MKDVFLNLMSPDKKRRLDTLVRFLLTRNILEIILFFCCVLGIALVLGWWVLAGDTSELNVSSPLLNPSANTYNQNVQALNKLIVDSAQAGRGYDRLAWRVLDLAHATPAQVYWQSLTIDRRAGTMSLSGKAATREALLTLEQNLQAVPWLTTVSAPLSQLLNKNDIDFQITATLQDVEPLRQLPPPRP